MTLTAEKIKERNVSQNKLFVCESFLVGYWNGDEYFSFWMKDKIPFTGVSINDAYYSFKTITYYKNGKIHRDDGPAKITFSILLDKKTIREYFLNGRFILTENNVKIRIRKCNKMELNLNGK